MRVESGTAPSRASEPRPPGPGIDLRWDGFRPQADLRGQEPAQRARRHARNVALRRLDLRDFERFLAEHVAGARRCRSLPELLARGRPALPSYPWEPGATTAENQELAAVHAGFVHALREALSELAAIRAPLEGRREPLDVRVEASVALEATVGGRVLGLGASLRDRSVSGKLGVRGAAASCELDRAGAVRCGGSVAGLAVRERAVESFEVSLGGAYGRLSGERISAGVAARGNLGTDALSLRAQARLGLDVQLLDAETVRRALSREDAWRAEP